MVDKGHAGKQPRSGDDQDFDSTEDLFDFPAVELNLEEELQALEEQRPVAPMATAEAIPKSPYPVTDEDLFGFPKVDLSELEREAQSALDALEESLDAAASSVSALSEDPLLSQAPQAAHDEVDPATTQAIPQEETTHKAPAASTQAEPPLENASGGLGELRHAPSVEEFELPPPPHYNTSYEPEVRHRSRSRSGLALLIFAALFVNLALMALAWRTQRTVRRSVDSLRYEMARQVDGFSGVDGSVEASGSQIYSPERRNPDGPQAAHEEILALIQAELAAGQPEVARRRAFGLLAEIDRLVGADRDDVEAELRYLIGQSWWLQATRLPGGNR